MHPKIIITSIVLLSLMASCHFKKKEYRVKTRYYLHTTRIIDSTMKVDTTSISGGVITTSIYDDTGRLASQSSSDGSITINTRVGNTNISIQTDSSGKILSEQVYFLDMKNRVDSFIVKKQGVIISTHKYIYDNQGNKIEDREMALNDMQYQFPMEFITTFKIEDGNVVSEDMKTPASIDTITILSPVTLKPNTIIRRIDNSDRITYYEYFMDKLNTTKAPPNSKNLAKRRVEISSPKDTAAVYNYHYNFDDKGRIITEVFESLPGYKEGTTTQMEYDSTAYTYY